MSIFYNVLRPVLVSMLITNRALCQTLKEVSSGTTAHIRGMSAVSERLVWASGTEGRVGKSTDGGETWTWKQIPGFEKIDFRDIEAFDDQTALVMGVASPGYILRTADGGKNWTIVYKNEDPRLFMDAMHFWNDRSGMIIGDPIDGRFFILRSFDGGKKWQEIPVKYRPVADIGEACFAASGSNITSISRKEAVFVSGGMHSRFFKRNTSPTLPLQQGSESTGANGIGTGWNKNGKKANRLIAVGGDFSNDKNDSAVCAISTDLGKTWQLPKEGPRGYRSGIAWIEEGRWITCGSSGVDTSEDDGMSWQSISSKGYHVCVRSKKGKTVFLAGPGGRIARLIW
jgi:photosystem II stability/assembly factor-like uncharacterized protein